MTRQAAAAARPSTRGARRGDERRAAPASQVAPQADPGAKVERILNIGCGPSSRWIPGTDGIDLIDFGQRYVGDFLTTPIEGPYDVIFCHHVIEHVPDTVAVFDRLGDLLAPGGVVDIRVPTLPYTQAFQDPTHVKFIPGEIYFAYFTQGSPAGHPYSKHVFSIVGSNRDRFEWELHIVMEKVAA